MWATDVGDGITAALHDVSAGVAKDLTAAANGADVHVDLDALRTYYDTLTALWNDINSYRNGLNAVPPAVHGPIVGVGAAMTASAEAWSGDSSLRGALGRIATEITEHLNALHDNFVAYLNRENDNVARLSTTPGVTAEKPLGW